MLLHRVSQVYLRLQPYLPPASLAGGIPFVLPVSRPYFHSISCAHPHHARPPPITAWRRSPCPATHSLLLGYPPSSPPRLSPPFSGVAPLACRYTSAPSAYDPQFCRTAARSTRQTGMSPSLNLPCTRRRRRRRRARVARWSPHAPVPLSNPASFPIDLKSARVCKSSACFHKGAMDAG